jgi:hypothetical protein
MNLIKITLSDTHVTQKLYQINNSYDTTFLISLNGQKLIFHKKFQKEFVVKKALKISKLESGKKIF